MASIEHNEIPDPMHGPVRLSRLDEIAQREMRATIHTALGFGSALQGFEHGYPIAQLAEAMGMEIVTENSVSGFEIDKLCEGRTSAGHIREAFTDPLAGAVDLGVRAMLPLSGRRAVHEYIVTLPVPTGRDSNAIATDHVPDTSHMAHVLLNAVGASDRQLPTQAKWFTTGTRHDHSSPRAVPEQIERIAKELGRPLPGPAHEHLAELFHEQREIRATVASAYRERSTAFRRYNIHPERFVKGCFPRCVIIESMPYGPPQKRLASSTGLLFPGDDKLLLETVADAGRYGVARCELAEPEVSFEQLEDALLPALVERFGEAPEEIPPERLERTAAWEASRELGVGVSIRFVRYWRFKGAHCLLRAQQISSPNGGEVVEVSLWRTIQLDRFLKAAVVLVERAHQAWLWSCVNRFGRDCAPGLCGSWKARPREAMMQVSLLPNASGVTAHRAMEQRRFRRD